MSENLSGMNQARLDELLDQFPHIHVLVVGGKTIGAFLDMVGRSVSFGWRPSNAYLDGKRKKRIRPAGPGQSPKEEKK